ncbi:hypothetical protein Misp01_24420 [Microtetraspora sp. NBRC 13810]|uniref:FtsB family cell division protein n=1 Tax=Microtetraspora sp. NBRC 13810 TaxID=3030990 RepID=UPI0024A1FEA0|nr:septum formation initiator family protein [Microtetraspora sp. NBRC 13810]GLW07312.1 hypothetical protein Misp01_24420 [Microtetraspora sp. NBRC 13810]
MTRRPQLTGRAAVLALVVCAIAMSLAYPVREFVAQRRQIAELRQEQERELAALSRLEERRKQLQDPDYTRQQARERLFYCGPGEKCFVVMDGSPDQAPARPGEPAAEQQTQARPPWYQSLWESVEAADGAGGG